MISLTFFVLCFLSFLSFHAATHNVECSSALPLPISLAMQLSQSNDMKDSLYKSRSVIIVSCLLGMTLLTFLNLEARRMFMDMFDSQVPASESLRLQPRDNDPTSIDIDPHLFCGTPTSLDCSVNCAFLNSNNGAGGRSFNFNGGGGPQSTCDASSMCYKDLQYPFSRCTRSSFTTLYSSAGGGTDVTNSTSSSTTTTMKEKNGTSAPPSISNGVQTYSRGFPTDYYFGCLTPGTISLTFSNEPSNITTSILKLLEVENVTATFFVYGENALFFPSLLKLIASKGHIIGLQSYSKDKTLRTQKAKSFLTDVKTTHDMIHGASGVSPKLFRFPRDYVSPPPLGSVSYTFPPLIPLVIAPPMDKVVVFSNLNDMIEMEMTTANMLSGGKVSPIRRRSDWVKVFNVTMQTSTPEVDSFILTDVLTADDKVSPRDSLRALEDTISIAKARGYTFTRLDECLGVYPYHT